METRERKDKKSLLKDKISTEVVAFYLPENKVLKALWDKPEKRLTKGASEKYDVI